MAKLEAVYCAAGGGSGKPQSQIAARRVLRVAKRWMKAAVSVPDTTRKNRITAPLYELRLSAIGTIESHGSLCAGMRPPASGATTFASRSITGPGSTPVMKHSTAKIPMAASEQRSTSCAFAAASVRGRPRKLTPNILTKQAAARAAPSASNAPTAGTRNLSGHCGSCGLIRIAWNVSHSDTKPLSGGSAEMATQPISTAADVFGVRPEDHT